jgi:hypothetical protein
VGPAFQDFRVQNFTSSGVQHQYEQAFEKEKMPSTSGFRGSESRNLKNQHQTQTNPEIAKRKEHRTNILGFRGFVIPRIQKMKPQPQTIPKLRKGKKCGTNISGFRGSGF